ncbi:MAG: ABC transporter-like protein [Parcubacteria group bacterium Gr01-1014_33]|nr:MAG: ABC transporter-like protein [Parcubacteria group bacterium Gr01-1014_33]
MEQEKKWLSLPVLRSMIQNSFRVLGIVWEKNKGAVIALAFIFLVVSATPFWQSGARALLINELVRLAGGALVTPYLMALIIFLVLSIFVPSFLFTVQSYLSRLFWFFLAETFELLMIKKKGEIDIAAHEDPRRMDLFTKVSEQGIWRLQNFVDRQFYVLQNIFQALIASAVLLYAQWWVFVIILIGSIPELIAEARYGWRVWGIHTARAELRRRFFDVKSHFESLPSLTELRLFQNIPYFLSLVKELFGTFQREERAAERRRVVHRIASLLISEAALAFAAVWFILEVVHGNLQIGTLLFLLASMGDLRQSISGLFANLGRQYQDSLFVTDVFAFLDIEPVIQIPQKCISPDPQKTPEIVFEGVTFSYPGTTKEVLKDFSLRIPPGEKVALVGVNGAGKTTVVKLLCRFYDPTKGRIMVDGIDLREIDLEKWYAMLGVLFQDYARYHFVVKDTIALGRITHPLSMKRVREAARASEASVFIEEWEKAYEQMLGKVFTEGVEPSVGQWQKLALARTFYRDPRVLILDEPTSSIDAQAEAKIFEKLEELPKDHTVILISHRFSTVRHADQIVVIENGMITEQGTHDDLISRAGTYMRLFSLQARGYR